MNINMNKKIIVFAGTYEGRRICEDFCGELDITACVATEYGEDALSALGGAKILRGRLTEKQMEELIAGEKFSIAIDATHPYAVDATANIKCACERAGCEYIRLLRDGADGGEVISVADTAAAARYLDSVSGSALITTGSKELHLFCTVKNYRERLFIRVLPSAEAVLHCKELGFADSHIIAMQGPFSHALNSAILGQFDCSFLVSKNSGTAGGFSEKLSAAKENGAAVILIDRPTSEVGYSFCEVAKLLRKRFSLPQESEESKKAEFFPLFISAKGKKALLVGGGKIASRRVETLLKFPFEITVVSPNISAELERAFLDGRINWTKSEFYDEHINGFDIVIAATDSRAVNHHIGEISKAKKIFVSVADCAKECDFYFPAVVVCDDITFGITGNGKNHTAVKNAAQKLRGDLK